MFSFDESEITFQVLPIAGLNLTQIVYRIEGVKRKFATKTGYNIDFAEVREKVNLLIVYKTKSLTLVAISAQIAIGNDEFQVRGQQKFRMDFHVRRSCVCGIGVNCSIYNNETTRKI